MLREPLKHRRRAPPAPCRRVAGRRGPACQPWLGFHQLPGVSEVCRRVDLYAEPRRLDEAHRDAHAGFEGTQLLEPLALFEDAARQSDKPFERGPAIGIAPERLAMP